MEFAWIESDELRAGADHGVDFFRRRGDERSELIAVLRGFDWYHRRPDVVEIAIRRPDAAVSERFLRGARTSIERYVKDPKGLTSHVSRSIWAGING